MANSDQNKKEQTSTATPQGGGQYVVGEAECINSIACKYGFFWKTLWNHPENASLRAARKDHNILLPGDRVHIPQLVLREEDCATDQRHRFKVKGVPSKIKIQLLDHNNPEPYANQAYHLVVDGKLQTGTVDAEGFVEIGIDPRARSASLTVGKETFNLTISGLDPINSIRGALQRLHSLSFYLEGDLKDEWDELSLEALKHFQSEHVLESDDESPSGEYDSKTRAKLAEVYGC
jgi:hypothetical protein